MRNASSVPVLGKNIANSSPPTRHYRRQHIIHLFLQLTEFVIFQDRKIRAFTDILAQLNLIHLQHQFFQRESKLRSEAQRNSPNKIDNLIIATMEIKEKPDGTRSRMTPDNE
jgi:hypothetical protein